MAKKREVHLALPVPANLRDVTVTAERARWKEKHTAPTEKLIRMLRYIDMRGKFQWKDRSKLHGGTLGSLLRAGLVARFGGRLRPTSYGVTFLAEDRRRST